MVLFVLHHLINVSPALINVIKCFYFKNKNKMLFLQILNVPRDQPV